MAFSLSSIGDWVKTEMWLRKLSKDYYLQILDEKAKEGVEALRAATPKRTGKTANSWTYTVKHTDATTTIVWENTNLTSQGDPVAILLQFGHGTGTGGYVQGQDYINPALQPVFDDIVDAVCKVVKEL